MPPKKKSSKSKKTIPEDFELSDDEPKMVSLSQEQKLTSKNIIFDCPLCQGKLQLRNEIEINPKGITCRCNPCSFKLTKNDKTMNVSKDDEGGLHWIVKTTASRLLSIELLLLQQKMKDIEMI